MNSIIQSITEKSTGWLAGSLLLAAVVLYIIVLGLSALWRLLAERGQRALARERLRLQIKEAKLRCQEAEQDKLIWNGYRKFEVAKKVVECDGVASFYLEPHDKHPLPPFKPGQFLTFQLNVPGQTKPVVRCYSISDCSRADHYRVTIKKALPPPDCLDAKPGLASSHFFDRVNEGDILDVKAPGGHFFLDMAEERPVVLIAGGVGVTPMLCMLNAIIDAGSAREVWFFFGVRSSCDHMFKDYLEKVAAEHKNVQLHVCYSKPDKQDVAGRDYRHARRVSVDLFKELLPSNNYDYYMCGPDPFMKSIVDDLTKWSVPKENIHLEAFGASAVKPPPPSAHDTIMASKYTVTFARSGMKYSWNPLAASLLDFAEENGVKIDAGCRSGSCHSCLVAIKSGTVKYPSKPPGDIESGSCLTCICQPGSSIVIDA